MTMQSDFHVQKKANFLLHLRLEVIKYDSFGSVAQLGEHLGHNQVVVGSNPAVSTSYMYFEEALSGPGFGLESAF